MKVNIKDMIVDGNVMPILNIIQWAHKHNRFQKVWGISFRPDEVTGQVQTYFETNCPQLMNAVQAQWPSAKIHVPSPIKMPE